jgi:ASPIC/UnbV protein/VCBS repeat protein
MGRRSLRAALIAVGLLLWACAQDRSPPPDVSTESTLRMAQRLRAAAEALDPMLNRFLNGLRIEAIRSSPPPSDARSAIILQGKLVEELLSGGRTAEALEVLQEISASLEEMGGGVPPDIRGLFGEFTRIVWLRLGQDSNCTGPAASTRCLFPTPEDGIFPNQEETRTAFRVYSEALSATPEDLGARYFLNVASMRLGLYPDSVPAAWLIPPESLGIAPGVRRFRDRAPELGLDVWSRAGGSVMEDFDMDGDLDLMISSWGLEDPLRYFESEGGVFTERTTDAGLTGIVGGLNMVQADYDNDGLVDVLVLRGGWFPQPLPNSLLRNLGDGRFSDVTEEVGMGSAHSTQTAAWGDFDNDGWIDLLIGNETNRRLDPAELYRNNGDGTFTDVAEEVGLDVLGYPKAVIWGDIDNDGLLDAFFSMLNDPNVLYHNEGPDVTGRWRFSEIGSRAGVRDFARSFPAWFFDFDNDGWLDLFVSGYWANVGHLWAEYNGLANDGEPARLYRNNGDGTFSNVAPSMGLDRLMYTMGSNFGDLDNDGFLDLYVGTGEPDFRALMPSRMFRNVAGERFDEVTATGGFGFLFKGHGVSFGDLDNDGDQDVYVVFGGAMEGDVSPNVLLENPGHGTRWITLRLVGTSSNRSAIGARLVVTTQTPSGAARFVRTVGSGGSFGASSLQQEIGLGTASAIRSVEVRWPSGATDTYERLELDRIYVLTEGSERAVDVTSAPFLLGRR